jgi:hypothetical protein
MATFIVATAMLAAHVSPAQAAPGDLVCPASFQANFTPALSATSTHAAVSVQVFDIGCASASGAYAQLRSGVWEASGTAAAAEGANPCGLQLSLVASGRIVWSPTGEQSAFDLVINLDAGAGDPAASVVITAGVLAGDTVTGVGPLVPNADCAANGLSSLMSAGIDVFA